MKMYKRLFAIACTLCLALCVCGCAETMPEKSGAVGTAIALGHHDCITEVTVAIDGYGKPKRVIFDDIFPVSDVCTNTALGKDAPIETIGEGNAAKEYYKYLRVGSKYFRVNEDGKYAEIGAAGGTGISDLAEYCKTEAGVQWYYDSFKAGALKICTESESGTMVGSVKLADKYSFNTANGSMRKRYSRYWSTAGTSKINQVTGLGFNGNMERLETYLLAYGFDALDDVRTAVVKEENGYNSIGGVSTGATLAGDIVIYLGVAKAAYQNALDAQK